MCNSGPSPPSVRLELPESGEKRPNCHFYEEKSEKTRFVTFVHFRQKTRPWAGVRARNITRERRNPLLFTLAKGAKVAQSRYSSAFAQGLRQR